MPDLSTARRLEGIGEYYFSQKLKEIDTLNLRGKNIINLGIGSPDLPPHPDVIKILQDESAKSRVHGYQSYRGSPALRNAIHDWYRQWYHADLNPDTEILPLIGSKEGILHICMTYLESGDEALIPNPGYPAYKSAVQLAGGACIDYELTEENNYEPDFNTIGKTNLSKVKLIFINYPHMPTGKTGSEDLFERILSFGKKHNILVVHDNPYSFILNEKPLSILSIPGAKECALELNSLSKSHNMAGWRIGMLCGAKKHIDEVLRFKSNMDSGMFLPLQLAAAKALALPQAWYESLNAIYESRREKVYALLNTIECTYSKQQAGMFVWAKVPAGCKEGFALSDAMLLNYNLFITPGGIFGTAGENYVRVSLCSPEETINTAIERVNKVTIPWLNDNVHQSRA